MEINHIYLPDHHNAGGRPIYAPRQEPWGMYPSMIAHPEGNIIEIGSWNRGAENNF